MVDATAGDALAELLFASMDALIARLTTGNTNNTQQQQQQQQQLSLHCLKLDNVLFSSSGWLGMQLFLAIHVQTMAVVSLQNVVTTSNDNDDKSKVREVSHGDSDNDKNNNLLFLDMIQNLVESLSQTRTLQTLEFQHMHLPATMWSLWKKPSIESLATLKLDNCRIEDDSMQQLCEHFQPCWKQLQELHVVLIQTQLGTVGMDAADSMVSACRQLESLWWVHRYDSNNYVQQQRQDSQQDNSSSCSSTPFSTPTNKMPMTGLRELVARQVQFQSQSQPNNNHALLKQLVLEGCLLNEHEIGQLCNILSQLPLLAHLKLCNLQLGNSHVQAIVQSIYKAQAPLTTMDWSGNFISQAGLTSLLELIQTCLLKCIQSLYLNHNKLDRECFHRVIDFLQEHKLANTLDVQMLFNPYDGERMAPLLAMALWDAEKERDKAKASVKALSEQRDHFQKEMERMARSVGSNSGNGRSNSNRQLQLEQENVKLKGDMDVLMKAFALVGTKQAVEEHTLLLERVAQLESILLLNCDDLSRQSSGRDVTLTTTPRTTRRRTSATSPGGDDRRPSLPHHYGSPDTGPTSHNSSNSSLNLPSIGIPQSSIPSSSSSLSLSLSRRPPTATKSAEGNMFLADRRVRRSLSDRRITMDPSHHSSNVNRRPVVGRSLSASASSSAAAAAGVVGGFSLVQEDVDVCPDIQTTMLSSQVVSHTTGSSRRHLMEQRSNSSSSAASASVAGGGGGLGLQSSLHHHSGLDDVKETLYEE
jgi:hypothetical protein